MSRRIELLVTLCLLLSVSRAIAEDPAAGNEPENASKALITARDKGLDWLAGNQAQDGSWGKSYTIAVTSFSCLSYLAASDEPFTGKRGIALVKGLQFLIANQQDGHFTAQGHTWIHGQGFATLASLVSNS